MAKQGKTGAVQNNNILETTKLRISECLESRRKGEVLPAVTAKELVGKYTGYRNSRSPTLNYRTPFLC